MELLFLFVFSIAVSSLFSYRAKSSLEAMSVCKGTVEKQAVRVCVCVCVCVCARACMRVCVSVSKMF